MSNDPKLVVLEEDFQKLNSLLHQIDATTAEQLEAELARATVVSLESLPKDVVTMNSVVRFVDQATEKENEVRLVYPHEANIEEQKISILSPIGTALIGLKVGQSIQWPLPGGKVKDVKVVSVEQNF